MKQNENKINKTMDFNFFSKAAGLPLPESKTEQNAALRSRDDSDAS